MSVTAIEKLIILKMNIGDKLTSISCGNVVVELIKFIAYQRLQIPYSYKWLKEVVRRKEASSDENVNESFNSAIHYRTASTALNNLDLILKSLLLEINGSTIPDEVCVALGSTPVTFKEVYRLLLPTMCHKPMCHSAIIANDQKIRQTVFENLVTSEKLHPVYSSTLAPTNMYLFIKKKCEYNQDPILSTNNFEESDGCKLPRSAKIVVLDFRMQNQENLSCCSNFHVFGDVNINLIPDIETEENLTQFHEIESTDTVKWYQCCYVMKGFRDCIVNGSSVTNQWLNS